MKNFWFILLLFPTIIFSNNLIKLAESNNLNGLRAILKQGVDVNEADQLGFTALHVASWNGYYDIVFLLLQYGANPNILTRSGSSPMRFASPEIVSLLKQYGAYEPPKDLPTPQVFSSTNVYIQQIIPYTGKLITPRQKPVTKVISNFITNSYFYTNIITNIPYPQRSYEQLSSKSPVEVSDLYEWDNNGNNAIHKAAMKGNISKISNLIKQGLDPFIKNNNGDTALRFAVENEKLDTVQYLVEKIGLDVNDKNHQYTTPIIFAALNNDTNMISYLAQMGANVNAGAIAEVDKTIAGETITSIVSNWTPLMAAAQLGNNEAIKVLLDYNADINGTDSDNWTALLFAVQNSYSSTAEFLIKLGIDYNIESKDKHTALSLAQDNGDEDLITLLISVGATDSSVPQIELTENTISEEVLEVITEQPAK